jgi:hypothetical protein
MFPVKESDPGSKPEPKPVDIDDLTLLSKAGKAANGERFTRL